MTSSIQKQYRFTQEIAQVLDTVEKGASGVDVIVIGQLVAAYFIGGTLSQLLGLIYTMQMVFLQPGLKMNYPPNVVIFFQKLQPFVTFDFLPAEYSTDFVFDFDEMKHMPYSKELEDLDVGNSNYIKCLGSIFLIKSLLNFRLLISYFLRLAKIICRSRDENEDKKEDTKLETFTAWVNKDLYWNDWLVFLVGAYVDLLISSVIAFRKPIEQSTFEIGHLKSGEVASYYLAIVTLPIIFVVLPGLALWILIQTPTRLEK